MIAGLTPPFYCRSNSEEQHDPRDPANLLTFLSYILPGAKPSFRHNTLETTWCVQVLSTVDDDDRHLLITVSVQLCVHRDV